MVHPKKLLVIIFCILCTLVTKADEGMWLPQLLEALNEKRMKEAGMKISASDIYSINKESLKDAIVSFGGFCTGEVISDNGLLLTNHHCGFSSIQSHSTLDHNLIRDGFWAKNNQEELPNPTLFVTFIVRIEDVTEKVITQVSENLSESERQSIIEKNAKRILKDMIIEDHEDAFIKPFFEGNKYYLFVTETYKDVRLVGAPPSSIGNFGKDTDNWMWPRHTGDFSLFRIYADKNNKPATYSPDNVPYKPKKYLSISLNGIKENDFTMIFGFPGRTTEYLPSEAVEQIMNVNDPAKIMIRDKALSIMDKYMRNDEAIKIKYASKYAGISNAWKKWQGEVLGLTNTNAVLKKQQYEKQFSELLNKNDALKIKYYDVLPKLINTYKEIKPYALARDYYLETTSKVELFTVVNKLRALHAKKDKQEYVNALTNDIGWFEKFFQEMDIIVDKEIFAAMLQIYIEKQDDKYVSPYAKEQYNKYKDYKKWAEDIYNKSVFADKNKVMEALKTDPEKLYTSLNTDIASRLLIEIANLYDHDIALKLNEIQTEINRLQRLYMQAQMDVFTNKTFYPDANSTLRVSFGNVNGYTSPSGKKYDYFTYLDGVMEKYKPGDYEFDVPEKLQDLYRKKDYGRYGINGRMPVCFIASNHTTGGNSGSPVLDAYGNLIGINFDRVWEGTMSDVNYDASLCRNIMVDIRYVLFIIDKFANAAHLINEMTIVNSDKNR